MGMYTQLQGTIVFKSADVASAFCGEDQWEQIAKVSDSEKVRNFITYSRSGSIPNGNIQYLDDKVIQFHTELKNYNSTINIFLDLLEDIADDWVLETKQDECSYWDLHKKGEECRAVNGDDSFLEYFSKHEVYEDYDVFDLNNLNT